MVWSAIEGLQVTIRSAFEGFQASRSGPLLQAFQVSQSGPLLKGFSCHNLVRC